MNREHMGERMKNRKGFTLIELMVVVLIISLLASIAVPKLTGSKNKARLASVKSDIRNLMTAQESYFSDNHAYANDWPTLVAGANANLSPGNTASVTASVSGWSATVSNSSIATGVSQCSIQVAGGAASTVDGVITCP
jgi:type IV pilus assembly protein PilA